MIRLTWKDEWGGRVKATRDVEVAGEAELAGEILRFGEEMTKQKDLILVQGGSKTFRIYAGDRLCGYVRVRNFG